MTSNNAGFGALKLATSLAQDMTDAIFDYGPTGGKTVNVEDMKKGGKERMSADLFKFIKKLKNLKEHIKTAEKACEELAASNEQLTATNEKLSQYSDICDVVDKQMIEWRKTMIGDGSATPKMVDYSSVPQDDIAKQLFFIGTRPTGECSTCEAVPDGKEAVCCTICRNYFHGHCSKSTADNRIGIKTLIMNFNSSSTKGNFKWNCDICATHLEQQMASTVQSTATTLGEAVNRLTSQMDSMKSDIDSKLSEVQSSMTTGVWSDKERISSMKSALLIKPDRNGQAVELPGIRDIAVKNGIQVNKIVVTESGDTYINLPSTSSRDKLAPLLQSSSIAESDQIVNLKSKLPTITIIGIQEKVAKETAAGTILSQNTTISNLVKNGEQLTVLFVKEPSRNIKTYTIVARVTPNIRDEIRRLGNKLYLGLAKYQVKDRFYIKRCNRCQKYHHYEKNCEITQRCGFCRSTEHRSEDCPVRNSPHSAHSCWNCEAAGKGASVYQGHNTMWYRCPTYQEEQDKLKRSIGYRYPEVQDRLKRDYKYRERPLNY